MSQASRKRSRDEISNAPSAQVSEPQPCFDFCVKRGFRTKRTHKQVLDWLIEGSGDFQLVGSPENAWKDFKCRGVRFSDGSVERIARIRNIKIGWQLLNVSKRSLLCFAGNSSSASSLFFRLSTEEVSHEVSPPPAELVVGAGWHCRRTLCTDERRPFTVVFVGKVHSNGDIPVHLKADSVRSAARINLPEGMELKDEMAFSRNEGATLVKAFWRAKKNCLRAVGKRSSIITFSPGRVYKPDAGRFFSM